MSVMLEEQELLISADRTDKYAKAYASDRTQITKFDKLVKENPEELVSRTYEFPKKYLSIRKKTRTISEDQREKASERFRQMWKDKKSSDETE